MIFRQLFEPESSTYTYILGDPTTNDGLIIDPVKETSARDLEQIKELGLNLRWILETHVHADHITGSHIIKQAHPNAQTALSAHSNLDCADRLINDNEEIDFGGFHLKCYTTPGHTNSCMSYFFPRGYGMVFSGDTLLIRACGRTDFQEGDPKKLFHSVKEKLFTLPQSTLVFPAHDYNGVTNSTIAEEREHNPRLRDGITIEEFTEIMNHLDLAQPKKINIAVPANLKCGQVN